jgi:hypothetical protein
LPGRIAAAHILKTPDSFFTVDAFDEFYFKLLDEESRRPHLEPHGPLLVLESAYSHVRARLSLPLIFLTTQVFIYGLLVAFGCAGCSSWIARLVLITLLGGGSALTLRLIVTFFLICHFVTPFSQDTELRIQDSEEERAFHSESCVLHPVFLIYFPAPALRPEF